jgi:NADPH2:quinone reductase
MGTYFWYWHVASVRGTASISVAIGREAEPAGLDAAEAATLILSWTTAYQLLHRAARVQQGRRVLVQEAAGAVGSAARPRQACRPRAVGQRAWRACGADPRAGRHADRLPTRRLHARPAGRVRRGLRRHRQEGYRRSFAALRRGGLLCAYGYSAGVRAQRRMLTMLMWIARLYLWRLLPGGKRARFYSVNVMRARHHLVSGGPGAAVRATGDSRHLAARLRADLLR